MPARVREESVVVTHARRTLMQTFVALRKKTLSLSFSLSLLLSVSVSVLFPALFFCFGSWFRNAVFPFRARFEFNCFGGRIDHTEIRKHCGAPKTEIPEQVRISLQRRFQNFWQLSLVTSSVADILHFFSFPSWFIRWPEFFCHHWRRWKIIRRLDFTQRNIPPSSSSSHFSARDSNPRPSCLLLSAND